MDKTPVLQSIQDGKVRCTYTGISTFPSKIELKYMVSNSKYKFKLNGKNISLKALIEYINNQ